MPNKILKPFNKVMGVLGLGEEEEEEIKEEEDKEIEGINKVVSINSFKTMFPKVLLKRPQELEDTIDIIEAIKEKKIVVLNMVNLYRDLAQRMLDIIIGGSYALGGDIEEIAKSVYLVAPEAVEITNELKEHFDKGTFINFD